jgi:hypothetical protein
MKLRMTVSEEIFFRSFQKHILPDRGMIRWSTPSERRFLGKCTPHRFRLILQKRGLFAHFAPTLRGVKEENGLWRLRFGRPAPMGSVLTVLLILSVAAVVFLLPEEAGLALCFFLPALFLAWFLFRVDGGSRRALLDLLRSCGGEIEKKPR